MKKVFLLALLAFAAGTAHAQTPLTKGKGLLTGTIGYSRVSSDPGVARDLFEFAPKVGTFVADNLAVGISASISLYSGNGGSFGSNMYTVGPFARYYRFVDGDKFALFGQGSLGYTRTNETGSGGYNQGYLSVTPGLAFFPIPRFGLEASLRGLSYATNFDGASTLDLGFSLNNFQLGAAYYFGK
ncbi:outer membrane beta-barrel protein [Hymenobacter coccineus]|uniref:Outer membrane protein beta-barrel domain-containing protein n=1 Tax=Hymenobacter coccineus TaxID=1908235 RepID=A0A1G1SY89_9BACT|nr:outer membrane beta-barrel protein [Hymenobacter coccineus]OGX83585.1 hypothetical protein BEN49_02220 [Hymenobacter coccineus]